MTGLLHTFILHARMTRAQGGSSLTFYVEAQTTAYLTTKIEDVIIPDSVELLRKGTY